VVIDNLNFMLSGQGKGYDKFENQDKAIEKLRNFATKRNV
jgi:twinkle protein